jgi:ubiquinone/menaquinone biosynthesis C-methylase UbiE
VTSEGATRRGLLLDTRSATRFDQEVVPRWNVLFARLLLDNLDVPARSTTLDMGCSSGTLTLELLQRTDASSRIIAIDASGPAMDLARQRAGDLAGKRVFFKTERDLKLTFAPEVFDRVFANLVLLDLPEPAHTLRELRRVLKRGGRFGATFPARGSFQEIVDLMREVVLKFDVEGATRRLDEYVESMPDERRALALAEDAGFKDVTYKRAAFTLTFRGARAFFADAIVEMLLAEDLQRIAGEGNAGDRVIFHLREAIDTYFAGSDFTVSVVAGAVFATRPSVGIEPVEGEVSEDFEVLDTRDDDKTV